MTLPYPHQLHCLLHSCLLAPVLFFSHLVNSIFKASCLNFPGLSVPVFLLIYWLAVIADFPSSCVLVVASLICLHPSHCQLPPISSLRSLPSQCQYLCHFLLCLPSWSQSLYLRNFLSYLASKFPFLPCSLQS